MQQIKILISKFQVAELLKQAWTSMYKSYIITKPHLKTIGINKKLSGAKGT